MVREPMMEKIKPEALVSLISFVFESRKADPANPAAGCVSLGECQFERSALDRKLLERTVAWPRAGKLYSRSYHCSRIFHTEVKTQHRLDPRLSSRQKRCVSVRRK